MHKLLQRCILAVALPLFAHAMNEDSKPQQPPFALIGGLKLTRIIPTKNSIHSLAVDEKTGNIAYTTKCDEHHTVYRHLKGNKKEKLTLQDFTDAPKMCDNYRFFIKPDLSTFALHSGITTNGAPSVVFFDKNLRCVGKINQQLSMTDNNMICCWGADSLDVAFLYFKRIQSRDDVPEQNICFPTQMPDLIKDSQNLSYTHQTTIKESFTFTTQRIVYQNKAESLIFYDRPSGKNKPYLLRSGIHQILSVGRKSRMCGFTYTWQNCIHLIEQNFQDPVQSTQRSLIIPFANTVWDAQFSPNGTLLLTINENAEVYLHFLDKGMKTIIASQHLCTTPNHLVLPQSVFSTNEQRFVIQGPDKKLYSYVLTGFLFRTALIKQLSNQNNIDVAFEYF